MNVSGVNSGFISLFISESNDSINNASIKKLNANHMPDTEQQNIIDKLVSHYKNTLNKKEREEVSPDIQKMVGDLRKTRTETFDIVNANTDDVYGILKKDKTEVDRDKYIQKLNAFFILNKNIKEVQEENGFADCAVIKSLYIHHSNGVFGDLLALDRLSDGNSSYGHVPDLTYNVGSTQFG